jgi:hypothetical protein
MKKEDDSMRVLATGTCDTLSGSSKLTYHIGSTPDGEIYIRVHGNTGGGFFSQEWVALQDILQALNKRPAGKAITSILLMPLYRGKSANTPGFLLSVLLHEKLVRSMQGKLRRHELGDPSAFKAKVDKLLASGTDAKGKTARAAGNTTKKAPVKKKATPSKRKKATTDRAT